MSVAIKEIKGRVAPKGYGVQILLVGAFFFIFGFITWVNGTLIPYLRIACELKEWQAYLVTFAFYISYTVMAVPSSLILASTGMVRGMRLGLLVMAAGCIVFIPAAMMRSYPLFLAGLFVIGTGTTLLQTAVNPYITLLGPVHTAAQRMSIMGICNKFAGVLAPLILGAIILKNSDGLINELRELSPIGKTARLDELARAVILPYSVLAGLLLLISFAIKFVHLPEIILVEAGEPGGVGKALNVGRVGGGNHGRAFTLGFIAIFFCVGLEVIAGDTIGNYGLYHGMPLSVSKHLTSYTLACTMVGYLFGALAIPRLISQEKAFLFSSVLGVFISILIILIPGQYSVGCVALLGLSNALMWPAIWPQALKGLGGKALSKGSAILIMGIAGGAIMPLVYGWVARSSNNQVAYWLLIPGYLFLLYYYTTGNKKSFV